MGLNAELSLYLVTEKLLVEVEPGAPWEVCGEIPAEGSKCSVQDEYGREKELGEMVLSLEKGLPEVTEKGSPEETKATDNPSQCRKRKMEDSGRKGNISEESLCSIFLLGILGFLESFKFWLQEREFPREPSCHFSCRSSSSCELRKIKYFAYPFLHQPPLKKPSFTLFYFLPRSTKRISLLVW